MLLKPGQWLGKGSVLLQGMSLGETVNVELKIEEHDDSITLTGSMDVGEHAGAEVSVQVVPNEVGTYTLDAFVAGTRLDGVGKLESDPNAALLWHENDVAHASVVLFPIPGGFGCRGFLREKDTVRTWEIAFNLRQNVVRGGNVVSLSRRRR